MDLLFSNHTTARKQRSLFDQAIGNRAATIAVSSGVNVVQNDDFHSIERRDQLSTTTEEKKKGGDEELSRSYQDLA